MPFSSFVTSGKSFHFSGSASPTEAPSCVENLPRGAWQQKEQAGSVSWRFFRGSDEKECAERILEL